MAIRAEVQRSLHRRRSAFAKTEKGYCILSWHRRITQRVICTSRCQPSAGTGGRHGSSAGCAGGGRTSESFSRFCVLLARNPRVRGKRQSTAVHDALSPKRCMDQPRSGHRSKPPVLPGRILGCNPCIMMVPGILVIAAVIQESLCPVRS